MRLDVALANFVADMVKTEVLRQMEDTTSGASELVKRLCYNTTDVAGVDILKVFDKVFDTVLMKLPDDVKLAAPGLLAQEEVVEVIRSFDDNIEEAEVEVELVANKADDVVDEEYIIAELASTYAKTGVFSNQDNLQQLIRICDGASLQSRAIMVDLFKRSQKFDRLEITEYDYIPEVDTVEKSAPSLQGMFSADIVRVVEKYEDLDEFIQIHLPIIADHRNQRTSDINLVLLTTRSDAPSYFTNVLQLIPALVDKNSARSVVKTVTVVRLMNKQSEQFVIDDYIAKLMLRALFCSIHTYPSSKWINSIIFGEVRICNWLTSDETYDLYSMFCKLRMKWLGCQVVTMETVDDLNKLELKDKMLFIIPSNSNTEFLYVVDAIKQKLQDFELYTCDAIYYHVCEATAGVRL